MTEAEKLAEAYFTLGMKPGGSLEAIQSRWKRLAMVWHSDRFPSEQAKLEADEELKNINNARDVLKKHFETSHKKDGPCACSATSSPPHGPKPDGNGPGPGKRRTTQETDKEEADAARRNKQRADQAAKAAAENSAHETQARAEAATKAAAAEKSKQNAEQTVSIEGEKLRWKIAICMAVAWIALSFSAFCLTSTKVWWTHLNEKWTQERQDKIDDENQKKAEAAAAADRAKQEQQQADDEKRRLDNEEQERKNQAITRAKAAIDQYQRVIDHCTAELAHIQTQLDDPNVAYSEKIKLQDYKGQNQKWLSDAQANYNMAQQSLADATGTTAPPPIGGSSDTPVPHLETLPPAHNYREQLPYVNQDPVQKMMAPHWTPTNLKPLDSSPKPVP